MVAESRAIGDVARLLGLQPDTIRYYERSGVLPAPRKDAAGRRVYSAGEVHLIEVLMHLRETGMPLAGIAEFTGLVASDPDGVPERLAILETHREHVLDRLRALQDALTVMDGKIADYRCRLPG